MSSTKELCEKLRDYNDWMPCEASFEEFDTCSAVCREAASTIERLQAELDATRWDARRYRWLRTNAVVDEASKPQLWCGVPNMMAPTDANIDAAIDALLTEPEG